MNNKPRIDFSKSLRVLPYPDFLSIQLESFSRFFKIGTSPEERRSECLYKIFTETFPITDSRENYVLEFLDYVVESPQYTIGECLKQGLTYAVPIKVRLRLYATDEEIDFEPSEKEVYLGNIPYMTPSGSFVINGAERVIVSQLHRSPGVFFSQTKHTNGTSLYSARIIPFRGSWVEFTTDTKNVIYAYIDRKKKFPLTTLLRAIGYSTDKDILDLFGICEQIESERSKLQKLVGRKVAARVLKSWVEDFGDEETGEVLSMDRYEIIFERNHILTDKDIDKIIEAEIESIVIYRENVNISDYSVVYNTLNQDNSNSEKEAVDQIYRQLRNTDPPDEQTARDTIQSIFFNEKRYDLGEVGRYKINKKLHLDIDSNIRVLTNTDIVNIVRHLITLINSKSVVDDIDHLSNRRIKTVGEQIQTQFGIGLARMARNIRERINIRDNNEKFTPIDLINSRTLTAVINTFFGTNQLSQFMDQTNPLAEITHKRRVSALGPGGLSRERAGFEVRDVHYTHYGRLCTIETPEGPNIGLISSLCVYAQINNMGFIETPYRKVINGKVTRDIQYLSAEEEDYQHIGQSTANFDEEGDYQVDIVKVRHEGDFSLIEPNKLSYVDVAPNQIVSVAASIIPFLEHDDANRALMGSNMQRQAVPLLKPQAPIVGTGLERTIVQDSRTMLKAEENGTVQYVDSKTIIIEYNLGEKEKATTCESNLKEYKLVKFRRTNQDTCFDQRPIVRQGDRVRKNQILTEGYSTSNAELALGVNLKVAFMPWQGYNFEDAIVVSERVVKEDIFTSIHIKEFSLNLRDSKRNQEEFTSEIPNVSEEAIKNLDEDGIIRVGSLVKEGDILIGKISPKGETDPTPEEKLLRAIFGDKAGDVRDASLKAKPSVEGVVIDTQLFKRIKKTKKSQSLENQVNMDRATTEYRNNLLELKEIVIDKLYLLLKGKTSILIKNQFNHPLIEKGTKFTKELISNTFFPDDNPYEESVYDIPEEVNLFKYVNLEAWVKDKKINTLIKRLVNNYLYNRNKLRVDFKRQKISFEIGDELPTGVVQYAKVYIAQKRKLKVGDKMAGRHGNKGVVARIVREEDMPFLEDGTPVDIVLNPLGVPSRMNIGQIYETLLGWAGQVLGKQYATAIFDGASEQEVIKEIAEAGLPKFCRTNVYDGLTGQKFDQPVTVGMIYMLKLGHMVDDKMHARSTGPYSLITQQPLGGKAQFGGQRFGEMEVWALEAYGAAHILQEMLTVKSDNVVGRSKVYESIVKNEDIPKPGIPESFNVLIHELRGLCLDVTLS